MIQSKKRAFWIGASDTYYVMGNWDTKTWKEWWMEKLGIRTSDLNTKPMRVGNAYEHKIIDFAVPGAEKDEQIVIPELSLRVNLDGRLGETIYEVKTYSADSFKVSKRYWQQAQAEMFALKQKELTPSLYILAYHVGEAEYNNYFLNIEESKLSWHKILYDESFEAEYVKRLQTLNECLKRGVIPR